MTFLAPMSALVAAGITVPLLVSLYFLKLRRKPMVVPSTLLWRKSVQDLQVNAPWQRIRNNPLLWLQLLLLALLLLAMARPTRPAASDPGARVVILIDRSASMNTADGGGGQTRLEAAKEAALELIDSLESPSGDADPGAGAGEGGAAGVMVVSFAQQATVVQSLTQDRARLKAAVRDINPTDQRSRLGPAVALIGPLAAAAPAGGGGGLSVYLFSDGRLAADPRGELGLPGAELFYEPLGRSDTANLGVVSAATRRDDQRPERVEVFARLINTSSSAAETNVSLSVDGAVVQTRRVAVPGATAEAVGDTAVTFELLQTGSASLVVAQDRADALPADDAARLQLLPARRLSVLLVTQGNPYLRGAIEAAGARRLELVTPQGYETLAREGGALAGYDVLVFDRYRPAGVPPRSSLSFGEAVPAAGLSVQPSAEDAPAMQAVLTWRRDHPLMRYVVMDDVTLRRPGRLTVPVGGQVLATGLAGPLIAEVREGGRTHVSVSFDVLESRWPHHWSFQVFMVNALETLGLSEALGGGASEPGGGAALAFRTGEAAAVVVPAGLPRADYGGPSQLSGVVREGRAVLPAFPRVGVYRAQSEAVSPPFDLLPVNLLDPVESDVRPASRVEVAGGVVEARGEAALVREEVWWWFAWAALGVLLLEWWFYTARMRV